MTDPRPASTPEPGRENTAGAGTLAWLRTQIRSSELWLVGIAVLVGAAAGAMAVAQNLTAHAIQVVLFGIEPEVRLSVAPPIAPIRLLAIPAGGLILGVLAFLWTRKRPGSIVDPVEANALRGGQMSLRDSVLVSAQTLISNGCGASVGLEAGYTQIGGGVTSRMGRWLLTLDTVTGDAGERLYRRMGWTHAGDIPDYALYPDGRPCGTSLFYKRLRA